MTATRPVVAGSWPSAAAAVPAGRCLITKALGLRECRELLPLRSDLRALPIFQGSFPRRSTISYGTGPKGNLKRQRLEGNLKNIDQQLGHF